MTNEVKASLCDDEVLDSVGLAVFLSLAIVLAGAVLALIASILVVLAVTASPVDALFTTLRNGVDIGSLGSFLLLWGSQQALKEQPILRKAFVFLGAVAATAAIAGIVVLGRGFAEASTYVQSPLLLGVMMLVMSAASAGKALKEAEKKPC
ncbi:MAG TPA: hypothetical protein VK963_01690 [Candidatus Saccharimonadales bacterium]|nr:hypothetical protein [Candidatus Saccharimonadales bacterium]